jgi:hypothetical protein
VTATYGTIMVARSSASVEDMRALLSEWARTIGNAAGFVDERALVTDDGRVVTCVRFRDRAAYEALADNPEQAAWWESTMAPLLDGEPEWIDGFWHDL